jgi:pyruvate formate lyase activating enzyme
MAHNVTCELCPRFCVIPEGKRGSCKGRVNLNGKLTSIAYGHPCTVHVDPVEKKPLFHFLPGKNILSLACAGCILHCKNCQNWEISQVAPDELPTYDLPPRAVVSLAQREGTPMVAFTYTDPVAFYEYALDTAVACKQSGIRTVLVTSGYGNPEPLKRLYALTDATNTDIKFIDDAKYREISEGTLKPVLDGVILAKKMNVWVELTYLIIPGINDSDDEFTRLCRWVKEYCGVDTPLHFSRFFPQYKMQHLAPTPESTLLRAYEIAKATGLHYVYLGNLRAGNYETTYSPADGTSLIRREGYRILENTIDANGRAPDGTVIAGVWS